MLSTSAVAHDHSKIENGWQSMTTEWRSQQTSAMRESFSPTRVQNVVGMCVRKALAQCGKLNSCDVSCRNGTCIVLCRFSPRVCKSWPKSSQLETRFSHLLSTSASKTQPLFLKTRKGTLNNVFQSKDISTTEPNNKRRDRALQILRLLLTRRDRKPNKDRKNKAKHLLEMTYVRNARLFTKCLFTILVPLNPSLPTSKVMDFLLNLY